MARFAACRGVVVLKFKEREVRTERPDEPGAYGSWWTRDGGGLREGKMAHSKDRRMCQQEAWHGFRACGWPCRQRQPQETQPPGRSSQHIVYCYPVELHAHALIRTRTHTHPYIHLSCIYTGSNGQEAWSRFQAFRGSRGVGGSAKSRKWKPKKRGNMRAPPAKSI